MSKTQTRAAEVAKLIDVEAVAGMLGVSSRHVYRLSDAGKMPRPFKLGGAVRWNRQTIVDWINGGCQSVPTQQGGRR